MFRLKEDTLGADYVSPADLKELGFFVNELGQIRMIEAPDKEYYFYSTNNERFNEMLREAMQECSRQETEKRLSLLGIDRIYLPGFTTTKPNGPHVPILAPAPEILKTRKRIIVIVNDTIQDIGILAYRQLQRDLGLNAATVVDLVKRLIKRSATGDAAEKYQRIFKDSFKLENHDDTPALVVLNTGQLLYSHKHNKALTMRSWSALPRKSMAHDMVKIHEENRVPGHRDANEHVKTVFEDVLFNPSRVAPDAQINVIAIENGTESMLGLLGDEFEKYSARITAMALVHSLIDDSQIKNPDLRKFLHQRAREWRYSDLTNDPKSCTELPENYAAEGSSSEEKITEHIAWNEDVPKTSVLSSITNGLHSLAVSVTPTTKKTESTPTASAPVADTDSWSSGQAAICPTFAGGPEPVGECILTDPRVQDAVLAFFEEVSRDPQNFRNPAFKTYKAAPQPTPDNPLALDPDEGDFSALPAEMMPEQADLDDAKETLERMKINLEACPKDMPALRDGREKLVERIGRLESTIETLEKKALATGGLGAGKAPEKREDWHPQKEGKQVSFAGTTVDSELLKAVGLVDTADEELAKLGGDGA